MKHILISIALITMFGCKEFGNEASDFVTIDVTKTYQRKELILQEFMEVEYIPLETNDEFITTGLVQAITKELLLLKELNRVFDGKISIFDRKGKGVGIFNRKGQGNEEYANVLSLALDEENKEIFVNSLLSKKILVYDLMGNFKRSFSHKENSYYNQIDVFDQNYLICHDGSFSFSNLDEKRNCFMLVSKQDGCIKEISIPYKERKLSVIIKNVNQNRLISSIYNKPQIPYKGSWLLAEPSSDTIYLYTQAQTMKPFIVKTPSIQSMEPEIFLYPGVITDRYCFLQTVKKEYDFEKERGFPTTDLLYDKQKKSIFECVVYNNDFLDKRPISLVYETPIPPVIINNDEIAFVTRLDAPDLVEEYKKGRLRGKLESVAAKLDEESNPVIMLVKYKK